MPERRLNDQTLLDTAANIEKRRRHETVRTVIIVQCITLAVILLFGLISLKLILDQTATIDKSVTQSRVNQVRMEERLERILADIDQRMVPRVDVIQLQAEVAELQGDVEQLEETNRKLTRAVDGLTSQVNVLAQAVRRGG